MGKREAYPLLCKGHTFTQEFHVADVTDSFLGADIVCGYEQIPAALSDILKTKVITPFGLWESL